MKSSKNIRADAGRVGGIKDGLSTSVCVYLSWFSAPTYRAYLTVHTRKE